jgi:hypothetical protein
MTTKIKSGVIGDGVVGTTQIADDAITSAKIADDQVTTDKLANAINDDISSKTTTSKAIAMALVFG